MIICSCNPFSDHAVRKFLEESDGKSSVAKVYKHCSGGESPNCGTCAHTIKPMVQEHNNRKEIEKIQESLPSPKKQKVPNPETV